MAMVMELAVGHLLICWNATVIRLNNWSNAEIRHIAGDTVECAPLFACDPRKAVTPFSVDRATLEDLVTSGQWEIVPVVESGT